MTDASDDMKALAEAFELFTKTTQTMEEAYRQLEVRIKQLDQELADKNRELALTLDYLNSILESMSDGVVAVDREGRITTFNKAATEILGFTAGEALGRPFRALLDREFHQPAGPSGAALQTKSGRRAPVTERDSPIAGKNDARIGYVKVFQDLSEIEALRSQLRQADRLAAIGEMAATVAHEIRNPLGGIRGFAALLARDIPEDDPRARLVQKILVGAQDLDKIVTELLEYTRPVDLRLRPAFCADLVETARGFLDYGGRQIDVTIEIAPELKVLADFDKMRQVFLNILINAVQSIEQAGRIRVSAEAGDHWATIAIADSGCGMGPEQLEQVFSPFFTTKEQGTGLGLAVAAKIVEGHGGAIDAESRPGEGATFRVKLPRTE